MTKILSTHHDKSIGSRYTVPTLQQAGQVTNVTSAGDPGGSEVIIVWGSNGPIAVKPRD